MTGRRIPVNGTAWEQKKEYKDRLRVFLLKNAKSRLISVLNYRRYGERIYGEDKERNNDACQLGQEDHRRALRIPQSGNTEGEVYVDDICKFEK